MAEPEEVIRRVRGALGRALHADMRRHPISLAFEDGVLTMAGELPSVAAKKLALEQGAAAPGVRWVADRLRVEPAVRMDDHSLLSHVRDALLECAAFEEHAIRLSHDGHQETAQDPAGVRRGEIEVTIGDGVVTLDGHVPSLAHKRIAGAVCWWVPGARDVVNALEVEPPEVDSDEEVTEGVRLVLEKDPLLDAGQLRVRTEGSVVTLRGVVASEEQKAAAEHDAWFTFGVDGVVNEIDVVPGSPPPRG